MTIWFFIRHFPSAPLPMTHEAFFLLAVLLTAVLLERVLITDSVSMLTDRWSMGGFPFDPPAPDPSFFLVLLKNWRRRQNKMIK